MENYAYLAGGLALLYFGGELVVRGSVGLAKALGVSPLLIGLVVIAFGTSSPELFVSVSALYSGTPSIAVGNVVGSNIANTLLVLGIGALIHRIPSRGAVLYRDGSVLLGVTGFFVYLAIQGRIGQQEALVLLALLTVYLVFSYLQERIVLSPEARAESGRYRNVLEHMRNNGSLRYIFYTVVGIGMLLFGARILVAGALEIATALGVSDAVIAVSLVAVGTSIPELAAVIVASIRRHSDLVLGGILGSNLFNILIVLGVPGLYWNIEIAPEFLTRDLWVMGGAVLVLLPFLVSSRGIGRGEALALLAIYAAYIYVLFAGLPPIFQS
jgi:cation:H+ antiporter